MTANHSNVTVQAGFLSSRLGLMLAAFQRSRLVFLHFGATREELTRELYRSLGDVSLVPLAHGAPWMEHVRRGVSDRLGGGMTKCRVPVALDGTQFQRDVWRYLERIPPGEVRTYSEVARGIGRPSAVRAVASACARNEIALFVPCHRVVRSDGTLGGYRWGTDLKREILALERFERCQARRG